MDPIVALLVGQGINLIVKSITKGNIAVPDAVPILQALNDALGIVAEETPEERTERRSAAEAIFARHSTPLVEVPK